jgi:hypothetical protein
MNANLSEGDKPFSPNEHSNFVQARGECPVLGEIRVYSGDSHQAVRGRGAAEALSPASRVQASNTPQVFTPIMRDLPRLTLDFEGR